MALPVPFVAQAGQLHTRSSGPVSRRNESPWVLQITCTGTLQRIDEPWERVRAVLQSDGQWRSSRRVPRINSSWTATRRRSISTARLGSQTVATGVPDNASFASDGKPETAAL